MRGMVSWRGEIERVKKHAPPLFHDARMAAGVTESLPNLKTGVTPKRCDAMKPCIHAPFKAIGHQKPCVVMKRTDAVCSLRLRSVMEE